MRQLCECGCGRKVTKEGNRFINGHQNRGKTHSEKTKTKIRIAHEGKPLSEEHKAKIGVGNKGKTIGKKLGPLSPETRAKLKGKKSWNKGKKLGPLSEEHKAKIGAGVSTTKTYKLKDWQEKCTLLLDMEEMKEENGKIFVHCTNSDCPNSIEKGGWFTPTRLQLSDRTNALNNNKDCICFYCSESCKKTCRKYGKSVVQLIKEDAIAAGIYKENPGPTFRELVIWREEVLRRQKEVLGYNECEYCGNRNINELIVHHEKPQKTHSFLALDPDNGIIACGANSKNKCHYHYGHRTGTECSTGALANKVCI